MKIIGINGIRSDGIKTTDRLLNCLAELGYETHDLKQPKRSIWGARFKYRKDARKILDIANPDGTDVLVSHSYGGLKATIAMSQAVFKAAFLFRPAMSRYSRFDGLNPVYCIYNPTDVAIWGGSLLLVHPFGLAGALGFKSKHVGNIRSRHFGHGGDFSVQNVADWALFIDRELRAMQ